MAEPFAAGPASPTTLVVRATLHLPLTAAISTIYEVWYMVLNKTWSAYIQLFAPFNLPVQHFYGFSVPSMAFLLHQSSFCSVNLFL
jgi:hypothetical protein